MDLEQAFIKSFRAYDVRGIYPEELNEEMIYKSIKGFLEFTKASKIILGCDARRMNPGLVAEALRAAQEAGVDVVDLGLITTDMLYFASGFLDLPGLSITASHNPPNYSGMKMIFKGATAVTTKDLHEIRDLALHAPYTSESANQPRIGKVEQHDLLDDYLKHILSFIDATKVTPKKVVVNTMFGAASRVVEALAKRLPLELVPLNFEINGAFPKGPPNPMLPHLRQETVEAVRTSDADFGVAWDGDADRVFFWDEQGNFIEGYYTGVMLAENLLQKSATKPEKVIHCARLSWLFKQIALEHGGIPLECKTGHGFIKDMMRREHALFAEEMSGHYYFRDNYFADNGMIPFLIILEMLSATGGRLSELIGGYQEKMHISGETNYRVQDPKAVVAKLTEHFAGQGTHKQLDGITVEFDDWRFNVRLSNNEPLMRLNIEGRSQAIVDEKTAQIVQLIGGVRADE